MKLRWKILCLFAVLALDIALGRSMYGFYQETKGTLFLPADAGDSAQSEVRRQFSGEKQIALTFDDGPHSVYTSQLLDGLRERGVHATFFLLGENIDGKEGVTHVQMSKETLENACGQIGETNRKIEEITGQRPEYLRPPYGSWNEELECATDMTVVLWSVDPLDWKLQNTNKVVRKIVKNVEPGDIILMHDVFPTSVQAALEVVDTLEKQGYTFVTVEELLVD